MNLHHRQAQTMGLWGYQASVNVALCSGQLAMSLMQTTFMFYYVRVFRLKFNIDTYWFSVAQALFMVWNSINDPLFGLIQDLSDSWMKDRRKVILYLSPLVCVSFTLLWFPWTGPDSPSYITGIHLICVLFLYDAFYSCVNVAWSALFSDSTSCVNEPRSRETAIKYSQFAVLLSVNIIAVTEKLSHGLEDFSAFQYTCVVVAFLALACFWITGNMQDVRRLLPETRSLVKEEDQTTNKCKIREAWSMTKQVLSRKDFMVLVTTNLIHNCRSVAHLNFASMATSALIPQEVLSDGSWSKSVFFAACTLMPQLLVVCSGDTMSMRGTYRVVYFSFLLSVLFGALFCLIAEGSPYLIMIFMLIDSILVHSIAPLFQILIADFVDDDEKRHMRSKPISSLIFSLNALLVKPAQSIAPVVVLCFLGDNPQMSSGTLQQDASRLWTVLCMCPLVLGILELLLLSTYSLHTANHHAKLYRNV